MTEEEFKVRALEVTRKFGNQCNAAILTWADDMCAAIAAFGQEKVSGMGALHSELEKAFTLFSDPEMMAKLDAIAKKHGLEDMPDTISEVLLMAIVDVFIFKGRLGSSGQAYRAEHDGQVIVERHRYPQYEAARVLLEMGAHEDDILQFWEEGKREPYMRGRCGYMAERTISETATSSIRVVKWEPHFMEKSAEE